MQRNINAWKQGSQTRVPRAPYDRLYVLLRQASLHLDKTKDWKFYKYSPFKHVRNILKLAAYKSIRTLIFDPRRLYSYKCGPHIDLSLRPLH